MSNPVSDILPSAEDGVASDEQQQQWFDGHYRVAAEQVLSFFDSDDPLRDKDVADLGCGDGITDLGLVHKGRPKRLVGFDLNLTDRDALLGQARAQGVADALPPELSFLKCDEITIPAEDHAFDIVISWSAFEHVLRPVEVLREIRRILRPYGALFVQLWPFFYSEHGSHLWHWFPEGFANLQFADREISERLRADSVTDPDWLEMKLHDNRTLNRITLDGLQSALLTAGFTVSKLEVMTHAIHLTPELNRFPLSDLAISGMKLLATPAR